MHVACICNLFLFLPIPNYTNQKPTNTDSKQKEEAANMNNHEEHTSSSSLELEPQQTNQFLPHASPPPSPFKSSENHRQSDGNTGSQRSKSTTPRTPPPSPPALASASTSTTTTTTSISTTTTTRRSEENEENGRERLKRHRVEVAGRVWIPEMWGQEELLKDWIDCSAFDDSLVPTGLMSARAALVHQVVQVTRRPNRSSSSGGAALTILQNRC